MGVVTVSSSSARTTFGLDIKCSSRPSWYRRPVIVSFKTDNNTALTAPGESAEALPLDVNIKSVKKIRKVKKRSEKVHAVSTDVASLSALEMDYNEAAAKLEHIFETSPTADALDEEGNSEVLKRKRPQRKTPGGQTEEKKKKRSSQNIVRSPRKEGKRLSLEMRIAQKTKKEGECSAPAGAGRTRHGKNVFAEKINRLVRDYSASTELVSLDWKKMKIPPVLPSSEHAWLFKLMQPAKELLKVKKTLYSDLGREPTDYELAEATYMDAIQLRKQLEVGRAARNKLIKHNLRLILFVMNKYFHDSLSLNRPKFQDLCQAGVSGLITAIDRFEPKRKLKLSTYGLFWIRHAIVRSMTLSSFTKVSFGIDSVKAEIQKSKLELLVKLQRSPTHEEIMDHVGMSPERYYEVLKVSKPVFSLNAKNELTQEEFIDVISDVDDADGDRRRQHALLRLALDDVLDSLKPKESLVIRQRYGLDGRGDRTLGEIAGNLNISREMVRKHEVKALMKLKHPARVDYLRHYIFK